MEIPNLSSILNDARADGLLGKLITSCQKVFNPLALNGQLIIDSGEDTTLDQKTKQIQDIAGKLETQLQMLLNKFNVKRDELSST